MFKLLIRRAKRRDSEDEKQLQRKSSKISLLSTAYLRRLGDISVVYPSTTLEKNASDAMLSQASSTVVLGASRPESAGLTDCSVEERGPLPDMPAHSFPLTERKPEDLGEVPNLTGQVSIDTYRPVFEGTYSSVYRGMYGDHRVAIKAIRAVKHGRAMRRKIRREMETWWTLRHPNILSCMGFVETEGLGEYGAMVSPWCKNGNALDYLERKPPSSQRVKMVLDVARGLRYLHEFNPTIVHGDLKPANVLIDDTYEAKLCDFGLIRLIQEDESSTGMTTTSAHTGTARYLAYELVESDQMPTPASDVYALGCIGLEFIFSRQPHAQIRGDEGNAHFKICREIARGTLPAPRPQGLDDIMTGFWIILESCWKMALIERPRAVDVAEYLEQKREELVDSRERMVRVI